MAEITSLDFSGDWRIVVVNKDAAWGQRIVVENTAAGTQYLGGMPGASLEVRGRHESPWRLTVQHDDGAHGWQPSWLRPESKVVSGSSISQQVGSEDITTPGSDRDYNDLVVRLEKVGMVDQPTLPAAIWAATIQMMPEGVFEASLGRYFMAVRVRNVWTEPWPAEASVGLTARCRQWLSAAGIQVQDAWGDADQAIFGQDVVAGRVRVGSLAPWASRLVYFKVDVANAAVRKHLIEVEVREPAAPDPDNSNRKAKAQISVSRTIYDPDKALFVSSCDHGRLTAAVKELAVDFNTFKRALGKAREVFGEGSRQPGSPGPGGTSGSQGCDPKRIEQLRRRLRAFLEGKDQDICGIWRELQCCCVGRGGGGPGDDGDWGGRGGTGMEFFSFPTVVDYQVDYAIPFPGAHGPIPFDDPWWKVLLIIIAIILTIAAAASAAADLANRSDDVVIGQVTRSVLNPLPASPSPPPPVTDPGSVDAAVVTLNGRRGLTPAVFSFLDAAANEENTVPLVSAGGRIDAAGTILRNAEIDQVFANLLANPADPAAQAAVRVFKSGARTGLTRAIMTGVAPINPRREHDDSTVFFINQVRFAEDPAAPTTIARPGDSGSLWLQEGTNAVVALNHMGCSATNTAGGTRIEDVLNALAIRFA